MIAPYFTTSARPARSSRGGSVLVVVSMTTARGGWKGADPVLALRDVDRGLAADRGIHHCQQRGRQLHAVDAAHPARCGESGHVADHAAAERVHAAVAGCAHVCERGDDAVEIVERLGGFTGGQHQRGESCIWSRRLQSRDNGIAIQGEHMRIADDQNMASAQMLRQQGVVAQQAIADIWMA